MERDIVPPLERLLTIRGNSLSSIEFKMYRRALISPSSEEQRHDTRLDPVNVPVSCCMCVCERERERESEIATFLECI